jgi:hypothetical protein
MDCFNDQTQTHSLNLSRKLLNDYDPIGLKSDLENLKVMDCLNFYELQYAKPTKIINVSNLRKLQRKVFEFGSKALTDSFRLIGVYFSRYLAELGRSKSQTDKNTGAAY